MGAEVQFPSREFPLLLHSGIEWKPSPYFMSRFGIDQMVDVTSPGNVHNNFTAGVGMNFRNIRIDYAFHPYGTATAVQTHHFSIGFSPEE